MSPSWHGRIPVMQLHAIRGGTIEELKAKRYNIGVGISLGNKWFTIENILNLTKWALAHTKEHVIVYVADAIHAINLEVRNDLRTEVALAKANNMGTELLNAVKAEIEKTFPEEEKRRIVYAKWNDIVDESYRTKLEYLYTKYNTDIQFRDVIHTLVRSFTSREEKKFTDTEINRLGEYVIEETPENLCRVKMKGYECDAFIYPYDGALPILNEQIQNGEAFPEIREKIIDTAPKVFMEVR